MAGLLGSILMLPFLPVKGVVALAEVLQREAERERRGSAMRQLEDLDEAKRSGEISADEHERTQEAVVDNMIGAPPKGGQD